MTVLEKLGRFLLQQMMRCLVPVIARGKWIAAENPEQSNSQL